MGVSENRGTPKSSILIGISIINHPFWGTTILGNTHIPPSKSQSPVDTQKLDLKGTSFSLKNWQLMLLMPAADEVLEKTRPFHWVDSPQAQKKTHGR